jgi:hypothetical protein
VEGYKINIQKPVVSLYTNNELAEKEIRKTISFIITSKNNNKPTKGGYRALK